MIKYISWDPGGSASKRSTGRTLWDEQCTPEAMESLTEKEFDEKIEKTPDTVELFIIESYRPRPGISHTGDKLLTAQRIGDIKGYARRHKIEVVEIPPNVKMVAALWSGMKVDKTKHMPDWQASYLIGYWELHRRGLIRARVLDS
jgi:hypothetical protein